MFATKKARIVHHSNTAEHKVNIENSAESRRCCMRVPIHCRGSDCSCQPRKCAHIKPTFTLTLDTYDQRWKGARRQARRRWIDVLRDRGREAIDGD